MKRSNLRIWEIIFTSRQLFETFSSEIVFLVFMDFLLPPLFSVSHRSNDFPQLPSVSEPFCHSIFCVSSSHRKFEWIYSRFSSLFFDESDNISFDTFSFYTFAIAAVSSLLESFCFVAFNGVSWKMFSMPSLFCAWRKFSVTWVAQKLYPVNCSR